MYRCLRDSEAEVHKANLVFRQAVDKHEQLKEDIVHDLANQGEYRFLKLDMRAICRAATGREPEKRSCKD